MAKSNPKPTKATHNKPAAENLEPVKKVKSRKKATIAADQPNQRSSRSKTRTQVDPKQPELINEVNTQIPSPETVMEVHHHPQLEHKPKPFKEYLLEGFMIFIAVMMGFIAENIREAITNHEHVQQLTSQLVQDLRADTASLREIDSAETQIVKKNDSLFYILQQPLAKIDTKRLQKLVADSHSIWLFHPSSGAIAAIKNELHLKQFSDSKIISRIADYERHTELLHTVENIALQYQRSFLDPFLRAHFTPDNLEAAFNHSSVLNMQMRNLTQEDLVQLRADLVLIRINSNELVKDNRKVKKDAVHLLQYVINQYEPEDKTGK